MPIDPSHIRKGAFMTGQNYPGQFVTKRERLPPDLQHFEQTAAEADRLGASTSLDEIQQRIARAKEKLDALRAAARRRK
jgi:hypothetical protein